MRDNDYPDSDWYPEITIPVDELRNHYLELALEIIERDILQRCKSFVSSHLLSASYYLLEYLLVVLLPRIVCILSSLEYICAHIVSLSKRWNIIPQNN